MTDTIQSEAASKSGFKIIASWDKSVLDLGSAARAGFEGAVETAIGKIEAVVTTHETIHIDFGSGVMPFDGSSAGVGGGESIGNNSAFTWTQVYNAAENIEQSASASSVQKAAAALLTSDNAQYSAVLNDDMIDMTRSEAMALGLPVSPLTKGQNGFDGWIALGSGKFDWAQNNPSQEDAVGTLEHEITEVMGRTDDLGVTNGDAGKYTLLDLFHYGTAVPTTTGGAAPGAAAGALDEPFVSGYDDQAVSYFSYNGQTVTWQYDTPSEVAAPNGEDVADWSTTNTNRGVADDSFDGAGGNGINPPLSIPDWEEMSVLGYTERTSIPTNDFDGDGKSDLIAKNTSGAVEIGELGANGQETFTTVTTLHKQRIVTSGNFLDDYTTDFIVENGAGALKIAAVAGTATTFETIGSLTGKWSFVGSGDFLGLGYDQFVVANPAGTFEVGEVLNGLASFTSVTGLPAGSTALGAGDFLGDGRSDLLVKTAGGSLEVAEIDDFTASMTDVGSISSDWAFAASGDFLGDGHDQFLLRSTGGGLQIGDIENGIAKHTTVSTPAGTPASEWTVAGAGQFAGTAAAEFVLRNSAGVLELGAIVNGKAEYAAIGSLSTQSTFQA